MTYQELHSLLVHKPGASLDAHRHLASTDADRCLCLY